MPNSTPQLTAKCDVAFVAILMLFAMSTTLAGDFAYTCQVKHIYDLSDSGDLEISVWEKDMKGSSFSVSRVTGEIIGEVVPTLMANSTKVINKGNEEYSFRSIAEFDAVNKPFSSGGEDADSTASIQLLEVQEFHSGSHKPFVVFSMGGAGIVTGTCR